MAEKVGDVWVEIYQPTDENGLAVGPLQKFEAGTQQELINKLVAAHKNSSVKLYQTRKAAKLGELLTPDPDEPIPTFESRTLSADERIKVAKMLSDPQQVVEGYKILSEATYGAPPEKVQESLRDREVQKRVDSIRDAVTEFVKDTPEYVESGSNGDLIKKYMEKKKLRYTAKNLKIVFEDLVNEGLITVRAPEPPKDNKTKESNAPASDGTITPPATPAPGNSGQQPADIQVPTEVRPKNSSSGLGRNNSSATPETVVAPKAPGISYRDINKMSAKEYEQALRDPEFRKQVDALYAKK